jgi:hypothetical protein
MHWGFQLPRDPRQIVRPCCVLVKLRLASLISFRSTGDWAFDFYVFTLPDILYRCTLILCLVGSSLIIRFFTVCL